MRKRGALAGILRIRIRMPSSGVSVDPLAHFKSLTNAGTRISSMFLSDDAPSLFVGLGGF